MSINEQGPGTAIDGRPKFDLQTFDQAYFDRLRQRVITAGESGMWVSVMLFQGGAFRVQEHLLIRSGKATPSIDRII